MLLVFDGLELVGIYLEFGSRLSLGYPLISADAIMEFYPVHSIVQSVPIGSDLPLILL